ncbi:hypothetical protein DFH27DRAFT_656755 [Peziza echinospora]|nr:hypothetical protein DFH27DRAFT_656755 [Peziza echinospora]
MECPCGWVYIMWIRWGGSRLMASQVPCYSCKVGEEMGNVESWVVVLLSVGIYILVHPTSTIPQPQAHPHPSSRGFPTGRYLGNSSLFVLPYYFSAKDTNTLTFAYRMEPVSLDLLAVQMCDRRGGGVVSYHITSS